MNDLFDVGIERSLLATLLGDAEKLEEIELEPSDFGYRPHELIFETMRELSRSDMAISEDFIKQKIRREKMPNHNLDDDILEIVLTAPVVGVSSYVKEVRELSLKRKLRHLASSIGDKISSNLSSDEIINEIEQEVFALSKSGSNRDFRAIREIIAPMLRQISDLKNEGNKVVRGVDTGFSYLNKLTTGFNKGELIILAARPSMGKTALALNMMMPTLLSGKGVAFFSLEMSAEQILLRILSAHSSIPLQRLRIGDLIDEEWESLNAVCERIKEWKLFIDDSGGLDIARLRSKLRRLVLKEPSIQMAVVDYLQIMQGSGRERHLEVAEISRGLKVLARELEIPIIALSQLNRSLESRSDRRPMLSDLRESGSIEQDADIILFIYRESVYKKRDLREKIEQAKKEGKAPPQEDFQESAIEDADLIIGKHRNGPTGVVKLVLHTEYTRFVDAGFNEIQNTESTKMLDSNDNISFENL